VNVARQFGERDEFELPDSTEVEGAPMNKISPQNIIRIAIEEKNGRLSVVPIYEILRNFASRPQISRLVKEVVSMETIEFEGKKYNVQKERNAYRIVRSDVG